MTTENIENYIFNLEPKIFAILKALAIKASSLDNFIQVLRLGETVFHPAPVVEEIFGQQFNIEGKWLNSLIHTTINHQIVVGNTLPSFEGRKEVIKTPDYVADSDLFRESGANIISEQKVEEYAEAMRGYGSYGKFPNCFGSLAVVSQHDIDHFASLAKDGFHVELGYSRALKQGDLGKVMAHLGNGHHRAYAAKQCGYPFNMVVEQFQNLPTGQLVDIYSHAYETAIQN